ncbi:MAG: AI-2E family transporter, partial [Halobaculum sp.]
MSLSPGDGTLDRRRVGWWLVGLGLAAVIGSIVRAFVGTLVFGLFVYYAVRPIHRRLLPYADTRIGPTVTTLVVAAVPGLLVLVYGAGVAVRELVGAVGVETAGLVIERLFGDARFAGEVVRNPLRVVTDFDSLERLRRNLRATLTTLGVVGSVVLRLSLSLAVTFFLLQDGHRVETWFRKDVADGGTTAYVFLRGTDADLQTVYFGNVLTVLGVTVASIVVYNAYNAVVPPAVTLPVPTLLAVLTGLATFVPLVVGKLVYLPAGAFLFLQAARADASFLFPVGFVAVAFVFLDVLPQT